MMNSRFSNLSRRSVLLGGLGATSVAFLAACGADGGSTTTAASGDTGKGGAPLDLSIGVVPVVEMAPIYIALDKGYFADEGLNLTTQVMQSAPAMIPSVMNGQLTFGTAAVPAYVSAAQQGLPIIATTGAGLYPSVAEEDTTCLFASPQSADAITRPKDLEGKTVTTNAINSGPYVGLAATIKKDGGDISKVNFAVMPMADSMAAMASGQVDAGLLAEPFRTKAIDEGLIRKFSAYVETGLEVVKPGSNAVVIFSSVPFTEKNADAVERFNRAMKKANEDANNDPQTIVDAMSKHSDMTTETLEQILKPQFATEVDQEGLQRVADLMAETGAIPEKVDLAGAVFQS